MKKQAILFSLLFFLLSCSGKESVTETDAPITEEKQSESPVSNDSVLPDTEVPLPEGNLELHFFEMNDCYGDSFLVKKGNFEILVDGGAEADARYIRQGLRRFVKDGKLDMVIVSHPHADHTGGLSDRNTFREINEVGTFIDYGYRYETPQNDGYESNRDKFISKGATYYPVYDLFHNPDFSPVFDLGDGVTLEILNTGLYLSPETIETSNYNHNDSSIACVLTYGKNRIFFAGDLEAKGERNLIASYPDYFTDYHVSMKASHHGSETSSCKEFLDYIQPENIFISAAVLNENLTIAGVRMQQHPYISTLKKYEDYTSSVYWNGTMGTINAYFDEENVSLIKGDGASYHYYHNGTQLTSEEEKDLPFPETKWYETYTNL